MQFSFYLPELKEIHTLTLHYGFQDPALARVYTVPPSAGRICNLVQKDIRKRVLINSSLVIVILLVILIDYDYEQDYDYEMFINMERASEQ